MGKTHHASAVCRNVFVSALGSAMASGWYALLAFRFLGGIAIGASSVMAPMYIAEIALARLRGRLVAVSQLNIVVGILAAFFTNYLLVGVGADNWRWMFGVMAIPAAVFFVFMFVVPESPRWLVKMKQPDKASRPGKRRRQECSGGTG